MATLSTMHLKNSKTTEKSKSKQCKIGFKKINLAKMKKFLLKSNAKGKKKSTNYSRRSD